MGRDKLSLEVGSATLLNRVHAALSSRCEEILIAGARGESLAGARLIHDLRSCHQGPLAGIEAGLSAARYRSVFVAAGDMPFLTGDLVGHLLGLLADHVSAVVPDFNNQVHPLCAAYGREVRPVVSATLDRNVRSVREMLEGLPRIRYVSEKELRRFGDPELLLMNVNSPEDLARAREALREAAIGGDEG